MNRGIYVVNNGNRGKCLGVKLIIPIISDHQQRHHWKYDHTSRVVSRRDTAALNEPIITTDDVTKGISNNRDCTGTKTCDNGTGTRTKSTKVTSQKGTTTNAYSQQGSSTLRPPNQASKTTRPMAAGGLYPTKFPKYAR